MKEGWKALADEAKQAAGIAATQNFILGQRLYARVRTVLHRKMPSVRIALRRVMVDGRHRRFVAYVPFPLEGISVPHDAKIFTVEF
jgi:hypothetical protein